VASLSVLVTGGAGRLGFEVTKLLSEKGYNVRAFDLPGVDWGYLERLSGVEPCKGDINDEKCMKEACRDVDAAVHLAALLPPRSERDRKRTLTVNVEGTKLLLSALEPDKRIIFASSVTTYGVTAHETPPINESHSLVATDFYSESKIISEKLIQGSGRPFTILRIAPISIADLLELPDPMPYKTEQRIECVYVTDAAQALCSCLNEEHSIAYNIGGGSSWQMTGGEYIKRFYDSLGVDVNPIFPDNYTALDWYDTSLSAHLRYQRTSFNMFESILESKSSELGLK
jgi:UDP-glucose 4-epimerase